MFPWLRALAVPEDPSSVPSVHVKRSTIKETPAPGIGHFPLVFLGTALSHTNPHMHN